MKVSIGGTLTDALAVANESLSHNNSDVVQFLDHLTANSIFVDKLIANTAFINQLFAENIKATGSIRVGERFDEDGFYTSKKNNIIGYIGEREWWQEQ